ncbi:MAG: AMIN domain-containing protein [Desulfovibrio sp.]|jgi:outer membrane biosynthesis protein TonB|nr:AMIN domain-containing protein [Desulfovibrio sp.]
MNKIILSLLLAVCVLGMVLIMLNERLDRKPQQIQVQTAERVAPPPTQQTPPQIPDTTPGNAPTENENARPVVAEQKNTPPDAPATQMPPVAEQQPALPQPATPPPALTQTPTPTPVVAPPPPSPAPAAQPAMTPAATEKENAAKPGADKPGTSTAKRNISRIVVMARDTGSTVRLSGTAPISYKNMNLTNPERVVIDLSGQWEIKAPGVPANPLVTNVRIGKLPDKTRIVIDLKAKPKTTRFVLSKEEDTLDVRIDQ